MSVLESFSNSNPEQVDITEGRNVKEFLRRISRHQFEKLKYSSKSIKKLPQHEEMSWTGGAKTLTWGAGKF